jgi:hypothetical protein
MLSGDVHTQYLDSPGMLFHIECPVKKMKDTFLKSVFITKKIQLNFF